MENDHTTEYEAVLNRLLAQKKIIDDAIAGVRVLMGQPVAASLDVGLDIPDLAQNAPPQGRSAAFASDAFFGLSIPDAARKYMAAMKRPCGTTEIVAAFEAGGMQHQSANFYTTVHSSLLRREQQKGDIIKFNRKWALAEWYPNRKRATEAKD